MDSRTIRAVATLAAVALLLCAASTFAGPASQPEARPTVALVLGGGGARGIAHIGVLEVLEELRVPVDLVVGTSMGAIVGGFYATGLSADELQHMLADVDWSRLFTDSTTRRNLPFRRKRDDDLGLPGPKLGLSRHGIRLVDGLLFGQNIEQYFQSALLPRLPAQEFDALPIRYRAVAADLQTGQPVVLDGGGLARAMRASMSLPAIFSPVESDGRLLVDGGIGNNLPVDIARALGADIIIAVDVSSPLSGRRELAELPGVSEQLSRLMVHPSTAAGIAALRAGDILIRPDLGPAITATSFNAANDAVPLGAAAARRLAPALAELSMSEADYRAHRATREARVGRLDDHVVSAVVLANPTPLSDQLVFDQLPVRIGAPLDLAALERSAARLRALSYLKLVRYDVATQPALDTETELVVSVELIPDQRTPHLLEYGATIAGDGRDNRFALRVGYLRTHLDELGSEWRVTAQAGEPAVLATDLYMPLDSKLHYALQLGAYAHGRDIDVYDRDGRQLGTLRDASWGGRMAIGRTFGNDREVQLGWHGSSGRIDVKSGTGLDGEQSYTGSELFATFWHDSLDDRYLPASGTALELRWTGARGVLGADHAFDQLEVHYVSAFSRGRNVVALHARGGVTPRDDAPLTSQFTAGGFGDLSGLRDQQRRGQQVAVVGVDYRRRLFSSNLLPGFIGVTVEYGNVWDRLSDVALDDGELHGALYFGYRSPLGPFTFGYGVGPRGAANFFVRLGGL